MTDEVYTQKSGVKGNVPGAPFPRRAPQARCPQAIGSATEAWRYAGSAQRHLCNEAKRSGSEGVYNRAAAASEIAFGEEPWYTPWYARWYARWFARWYAREVRDLPP